jgi:hypothetical protein
VSGRSLFSRLLIYENGKRPQRGFAGNPVRVLDIISVAESADQFRALGCQTVQCNRSAFARPRDDLLGALAIPTIYRASEMAVGRINRKAAAGAAKQEAIFNAGFDQFGVGVSLRGLARFRFVIAGLRLLDNWWLRLDFWTRL